MNETLAVAPGEGGARASAAANPYPGLRPFLPAEADIFFGREQMTDEVLVRLNERHLVVVHGASGCGKSSLVAAGVLPQLARRRARRGLVLRVGTFRPGSRPMHLLVEKLAELCSGEGAPVRIEQVYQAISERQGARAALARLAKAGGIDQVTIVIDQFEELFRFAEDESFEEAQRFAETLVSLAGAADRPPNWWDEEPDAARSDTPDEAAISFLLTMRSEFLGDCSRYPGLAEAINRTQYLLPNMERADLIRAIREPAEVFGGSVDHDLAERIADDAAREQDSLPLVQHALMRLWQTDRDSRLSVDDYLGAIAGSGQSEALRQRSPLGAILAGHADSALNEVAAGNKELRALALEGEKGASDESRDAASFIFRALSRKDSEGRATRCPQRLERLEKISGVSPQATRAIVDAFRAEGASFLTPYMSLKPELAADDVIDISHEALIRTWPRMSDRTIDPADAQPIGWVEREAQEAMLWRWVALHARFFQSNPKAYLDGATTERLTAWFDTIRRRPEWVRPYLLEPQHRDKVTDEPEWQAVEQLLGESERKTWIERKVARRWKRLGRASLFLLVLVIAAVSAVSYLLYNRYTARAEADAVEHRIADSLRATDDFVGRSNAQKVATAFSQTELVDEDIAREVSAGAGGAVTQRNAATGYIWIGSTGAGAPLSNLRDLEQNPGRVRVGGRYVTPRSTVIRAWYPDGAELDVALGLLARNTPFRILEVQHFRNGNRVEHWAHVSFKLEPPQAVRIAFARDRTGARAHFREELGALGYAALPATAAFGEAGGAAVFYCRAEDRAAATQLAAKASRWVAQFPGMGDILVTPRRMESCAGLAKSELGLRIDFAPAVAWLYGDWSINGNCATPMRYRPLPPGRIQVEMAGNVHTEVIGTASASAIVTDRNRYAPAGNSVTVSELTGARGVFRLERCVR